MKTICNIYQDLLPLVEDGVASEESIAYVEQHRLECSRCSTNDALYAALPEENKVL